MIYRIFLLLITCIGVYSVKKAEKFYYDMQCDCGQRKMDEKSEKDCEESAKLESANQGGNSVKHFCIYVFTQKLNILGFQ